MHFPRVNWVKHKQTFVEKVIEFMFHFQITWIDGHGNVLTDNIDYIVEPLSDGRRFTAKSVLKLMPRKHHHNTTFTCQAQNAADRTYRSAKLKLQVKYAPKVFYGFDIFLHPGLQTLTIY